MLKKRIYFFNGLFLAVIILTSCNKPIMGSKDMKLSVENRIEDILKQMTLEEKITLLGGDDTRFNGCGVQRLGIPPIRMSDGPVGVRTGEATAFPASVNMAASWDTALIYRYGVALGEETKAKGKNCILGPCVGIHRFPLNGRNFESFGEDPYLAARMAVNVIKGVQSQNVIATIKHYVCNDQEWERNNYDVVVDERTLREIQLPAFEYAVKEANVRAVMSAYNIVNGEHCSENKHLLTDILKNDWNFKGIVMSDWVSVYSADKAANNGLDLEMPRPKWFKDVLLAAVKSGQVSQNVIDDKVHRHLRVRLETGLFENPSPKEDESIIQSESHQNLALEIAQKSIILLKNDNILPLAEDKIKTIALIGPSAKTARTGGGGSSRVRPWKAVSPYEGLINLLGDNVKIKFAEGARIDTVKAASIPSKYLRTPDGQANGLLGEYYNNPRLEGKAVFIRVDSNINFDYKAGSPDPRINPDNFSIRWTGKFIPPATQTYHLSVSSNDGSRLYINGKLAVDNWGNLSEKLKACKMRMEAGKAYDIKIEFNENGGNAVIRLGWKDPTDKTREPTIEEAVQVAKNADVVVLCVGNTADYEGEGSDVADFKMVGDQDKLVQAVAKANPNTVVVVYGGVPVLMKNWLNNVKAVIVAMYPGQEGGNAISQILFGKVNPSGKLPFTYIQERGQSPAFKGYKDPGLKVHYSEGVFVGYRYYDKNHIEPLFPFGYGLSYTTFEYGNLKVQKTGDMTYLVSIDVKNTGKAAGQEVIQLYVSQKKSSVERPVKELKGFSKVNLMPGETKTVEIKLENRAFQFYHPEKRQWTAEPGEFEILAGTSSRDLRLKDMIKL